MAAKRATNTAASRRTARSAAAAARSSKRARPKATAKRQIAKRAGNESSSRKPPVETGETLAERRTRAKKILKSLRKRYGPASCALEHDSALQLLIATILSAQSTDETINRLTPQLWAKYDRPEAFARVAAEELEADIRPSGFFRNKTKSIQGTCRLMLEEFDGQVPGNMEDLLRLPGVARKTANVVLGTWFGRSEGVVVDTHVGRLSQRLGLTWTGKDGKDAVKIEADLMELLPRKDWTYFSHAMIRHGRQVCAARKPDCTGCSLARLCPSAGTFD